MNIALKQQFIFRLNHSIQFQCINKFLKSKSMKPLDFIFRDDAFDRDREFKFEGEIQTLELSYRPLIDTTFATIR
jgi:hypothetical protein